jgi:NAD(P)-dependent dehydrogenase (short-subunit alcohol dehydrogenase family)
MQLKGMIMQRERIALVTGANKGIGLEIARQLAEAGVHVIIGARNDERGRAAVDDLASQNLIVQSVRLDLDDLASVEAAAATIREEHGKLDILVNNAGIFDFSDAPPSSASIEAVRRVMDINFIGALAVTQAMLPLLKKAPAGRIVNLSSSLGSLTLNADPTSTYYSQRFIGYNASKAALNMLTIQLSAELRNTSIVVNSVSPGFVKTDLTGYGNMTPQEGAKLPVRYALSGDQTGVFVEPDGMTPW